MKRILKIKPRIVSPYGQRIHPITKVATFHNGVDIAAPVGTPVFAPAAGKCSSTYIHETGGLTFIFDCDNGIQLRMCHLSKIFLKAGQRICAGDVICATGNTGRSTGPHLHLGVMQSGVRVDPITIYPI